MKRTAFTVIELLMVIAIIAVLVSLLLPTMTRAREAGKAVTCQAHERQLWQAWMSFAADHDTRLPGCVNDAPNPDEDKRDWLMGGDALKVGYMAGPQEGTVFKYLGGARQRKYDPKTAPEYLSSDAARTFRCPSLEVAPAAGGGARVASNGRFDYVAYPCWTGCRLDRVPPLATFTYPDKHTEMLPTPLITEESSKPANSTEGVHANSDQMGHQHRGGAHFAAIDGSVQWFKEPMQSNSLSWTAMPPSGVKPLSLGTFAPTVKPTWSWWEHQ